MDYFSYEQIDRAAHRRQAIVELLLIFVVFAIEGGWPVPDVNEAHYLAKAKHFWDPAWLAGDTFLDSADTHFTFYVAFGWLTLLLPLPQVAWVGRVLTWLLLAWAWRRLSVTVFPRRWWCVATAASFVYLQNQFHMAGEWVVGGVEAKGFAYALVLFGVEAMIRKRWNLTWVLLGAASAFHVLVGGWAVVAAAVAWAGCWGLADEKPPLLRMIPGLVAGLLLALPGIVPALGMATGVPPDVMDAANRVYVYARLTHHLVTWGFPLDFRLRFVMLCVLWGGLALRRRLDPRERALHFWVLGSLLIAAVGCYLSWMSMQHPTPAARLLRFYWFRLSDTAVPLGVALAMPRVLEGALVRLWHAGRRSVLTVVAQVTAGGLSLLALTWGLRLAWSWDTGAPLPPHTVTLLVVLLLALPAVWLAARLVHGEARRSGTWLLATAVLGATFLLFAPAGHLAVQMSYRVRPIIPRSESPSLYHYYYWRRACHWVRDTSMIPRDATFLTPRMSRTFKWQAHRSEVATWKDIPQDPESILRWYGILKKFHATGSGDRNHFWFGRLSTAMSQYTSEQIRDLGDRYGFDYILAERYPRLPLHRLYYNRVYAVYSVQAPPWIRQESGRGRGPRQRDGRAVDVRFDDRFSPDRR